MLGEKIDVENVKEKQSMVELQFLNEMFKLWGVVTWRMTFPHNVSTLYLVHMAFDLVILRSEQAVLHVG